MSRFVLILPWLSLVGLFFGLLIASVYFFARGIRKDIGWQKALSAVAILVFGTASLLTLALLGAAVLAPPLEPKDPDVISRLFEAQLGGKPDPEVREVQASYYPNWEGGRVFIQFQGTPSAFSNLVARGFTPPNRGEGESMLLNPQDPPPWWSPSTNQSAILYTRTSPTPAVLVVDNSSGSAAYYRPPLK